MSVIARRNVPLAVTYADFGQTVFVAPWGIRKMSIIANNGDAFMQVVPFLNGGFPIAGLDEIRLPAGVLSKGYQGIVYGVRFRGASTAVTLDVEITTA